VIDLVLGEEVFVLGQPRPVHLVALEPLPHSREGEGFEQVLDGSEGNGSAYD
jgi:hypothetical protein